MARRVRNRWLVVVCVALIVPLAPMALHPKPAHAVPSGFTDSLVATVDQPMDVDWTPDGRMLVVSKTGRIRVIQNGTLLPTPALNLSAVTCLDLERGAEGLAVHPDFATNHFVYLYYTYPKFGPCDAVEPVNRLSRFVLGPSNVIDPGSERVLLETPQLGPGGHHNAGDLEFGRDGFLYATIGDGNRRNLAPDLGYLLGKVVRLTDDGDIPAGNPYVGAGTARCNKDGVPPTGSPAGTKCQEVYASGFRNPFRMTSDPNAPGTRIFVNDVGEDSWEEIDELQAGKDYGWPTREGPCTAASDANCTPVPQFAEPLHWYGIQGTGGAMTGGAFVPNGLWPSEYNGKYLFGDFVFGQIFRLDPGGANCRTCLPPTSAFTQPVFTDAPFVVEMAFGPFGSTQALYYVRRDNNQVRRIAFTGSSNRSPTAVATATTPTSGPLPLTVNFSSAGSSDPDGDPLTYRWNFGDGSTVNTAANPSHTFTTAGTYEVVLTVDDAKGGTNTATVRVDAGNSPPIPVIAMPAALQKFSVGEVLTLSGSATDPEDGALADVDLSWEVRQHHNTHFHPYLDPTPGNNLTIVGPEPENFNSTQNSYIEVRLTATDSNGLSTTVSRNVMPRLINVNLESEPSGFNLLADGLLVTTPSALVGWNGWKVTIEAPDQLHAGEQYQWASWSDGGAQAHQVTVPIFPATYTATFATGDAPVVVTPGAASVVEGDTGSRVVDVPVTLNRASPTPVTVDWSTHDTGQVGVAKGGVDYVAGSGTLTFAPGETHTTIPITVLGDTIGEHSLYLGEWGLIAFSNVSPNATLNTAFFGLGLFVIADDDPPGIRPGTVVELEGNSGPHVVHVPVTLTRPSETPITVDWTTFDTGGEGIARPGVDYAAASGTLTFAPGETSQTVPITVFGDTVAEPQLLFGEWGLVSFSNPSANASLDVSFFGLGIFVIVDDDTAPAV